MFVSKEIPSGVVDGINKTFILANTPDYIDDVFVDGVIYVGYTLTTNILTLVDAPTHTIYVDYTTTSAPVPVTTTVTFGDIKDEVWLKLGQTPNSTNFSDRIVGDRINSLCHDLYKGRVTSLIDINRTYRAGKLWFIEGKSYYKYQIGATLGADFNPGDTTLTCDTSSLLGAGYILIGGEVVNYTGTDANGLTGVSLQTISHLEGEKVEQLYTLPAGIDKPNTVSLINSKNNNRYPIDYNPDQTETIGYDIIRVGDVSLLRVTSLQSENIIEVNYNKKYTDMTADTDVCPLPDKYGITVLAKLVAGELAFENLLPNAQPLLVLAYTKLQNFFQDFTNVTTVIKQKLKPTSYGYNSIKNM